jgi:hypothetical protein
MSRGHPLVSDYHTLMSNDLNYALEPNAYLEQIKNETDKEKRYQILKKYFTEKITRNLYQNMDLLYSTQVNVEQFQHIYTMVEKDLFMNILLAVDTLISEGGINKSEYGFNSTVTNNTGYANTGYANTGYANTGYANTTDEYSICESYMLK